MTKHFNNGKTFTACMLWTVNSIKRGLCEGQTLTEDLSEVTCDKCLEALERDRVNAITGNDAIIDSVKEYSGNIAYYVQDQALQEIKRIQKGWKEVSSIDEALESVKAELMKATKDLKERGVIK